MALGAQQLALARARLTGRAVPINVNGVTLMALPNGNISGYGVGGGANALSPQTVAPSTPSSNVAGVQGLTGSPSGPAASTGPFGITSPTVQQPTVSPAPAATPAVSTAMPSVDEYGRVIPTINVPAQAPVQATLNQANPNTTYVSPNTAQPAGSVPVTGQTDIQSGQPVHATYNMPPAPDLATQAKNYRAQHGISNADDAATDALNAESLAAARAGRTSFNPQLAAQYGQPQAAGTYGPRTDVVNALTAPTTTQGQPIMLAPTTAAAAQPATVGNNLLQQGVY